MALIVAGAIVVAGVRLLTRSSRVLVDETLPDDELAAIREEVVAFGPRGVAGFHKLRARRAGAARHVDLHVQFRAPTTLESAHETTHEGVVDTWQATLKSNLDGLQVTVADKTDAGLHAAVQPKWDAWIGQYKADQKLLDPFSVVVDCAAAEEEEESASAAGSEGATGEGGPEIAEAASEEADEGSPATT